MSKPVILITGHDGMLGRALTTHLRNIDKYNVLGVDNFSRRSWSPYQTYETKKDVTDTDTLADYLAEYGVDIVINAAADVGGVFHNASNNAELCRTNTAIQTSVVAACERAKVNTLVQISSVCVYTPSKSLHVEGEELGDPSPPNSGYAMAKRAGEIVARNSKIDRVLIVRPPNMIGLHDHYDNKAHVIPALIRRGLTPGPLLDVYAAKETVREFLWAGEAAKQIMTLIESGTDRWPYNLRPNIVTSDSNLSGGPIYTSLTLFDIAMAVRAHTDDTKMLRFHPNPGDPEPVRRVGYALVDEHLDGENFDYMTIDNAIRLMVEDYTR